MPIPVQLYNSLVPVRVRYVPVQLCRTTTTTRVLYRSTTTVPVRILLGKLYSVQPYSCTRTLNLRRSQKVTKTTVFVCWNIFFKKSSWNRFAARTRLERHTCTVQLYSGTVHMYSSIRTIPYVSASTAVEAAAMTEAGSTLRQPPLLPHGPIDG